MINRNHNYFQYQYEQVNKIDKNEKSNRKCLYLS